MGMDEEEWAELEDEAPTAVTMRGELDSPSRPSSASGGDSSEQRVDLEVVCEVPPILGSRFAGTGLPEAMGALPLKRLKGVCSSPQDLSRVGGPRSAGRRRPMLVRQGSQVGNAVAWTSRGLGEHFWRRKRSLILEQPAEASDMVRSDSAPGCGINRLLAGFADVDVGGEAAEGSTKVQPTIQDLGLPGLLRRRCSSTNLVGSTVFTPGPSSGMGGSRPSGLRLSTIPFEVAETKSKSSILDFEHLFVQYYVEVRSRWSCDAFWHGGAAFRQLRHLQRRAAARRASAAAAAPRSGGGVLGEALLPDAHDLAEAWKAAVLDYVWEHRAACQQRWPDLRMSRHALEGQLAAELVWRDELRGPSSRVILTLEPERICHRLLWAVGDAIPPARLLFEVQAKLRARWPQCHIRCADDTLHPSSVLRTLLLMLSLLLGLALRVLWFAALAVYRQQTAPKPKKSRRRPVVLGPSPEELLDQLSARLLLAGSLGGLWLLYAVAATFPLRSLHSPFRRDLGCLAAYSSTALRLCRLMGPLTALATPAAVGVRFHRLGLLAATAAGQPLGFCSAAVLLCSLALPLLAGLATWSVRSSLYSHHHLCMVLLFVAQLASAMGFAAHFEMVRWAVFAAGAAVVLAFYLFSRYAAEFTSVSLLKAAQLQWACAHMVPVLGLLLSAALEVESGVARVLVDFICESQGVIPTKMCIRMLRGT